MTGNGLDEAGVRAASADGAAPAMPPATPAPGAGEWGLLAALLLAAAIVRMLGIVATEGSYVPYSDSAKLIWMARMHLGTSLVEIPEYFHPVFPLALAGFFALFGDTVTVARAASFTPLLILLVPLFLWTRRYLGVRAAWWTAVLGAFLPGLASASLEVFDVNLAALLLVVAAWAGGWPAPFLRGLTQGGLVGLAYLTRPECALFGIGLAIAAIWEHGGRGNNPRRGRLAGCARELVGLTVGFLLFAAPYLVHLRLEHGRWLVSPKQVVLEEGLANRGIPAAGGAAATGAMRSTILSVRAYGIGYLPAAIPPFLLLLALGAAGFEPPRTAERRNAERRLLLMAGTFLLTFPVTLVPSYRYLIVILPLLLPWVGRGAEWFWAGCRSAKLLAARPGVRPFLRAGAAIALATAVAIPYVRLARSQGSFGMDWPSEYLRAADWFRSSTPPGSVVGYGRSSLVFVAERRLRPIPSGLLAKPTPVAELPGLFRAHGARYLVFSERFPPTEPALMPWYESVDAGGHPGLSLRFDWGTGRGVAVFDFGP